MLIIVAAAGGQFAAAAFALFAGRIFGVMCLAVILRIKAPWLKYGFGDATTAEITRLIRPALAGMALPLATAIYLQGMVIVLGAVVGLRAVSIFTTVRTLTRFGTQAASNINLSVMPEFSAAAAKFDSLRQSHLFAFSILACTAITVGTAILLSFAGTMIIRIWTGGQIVPSPQFVILMCLVMVLNSAWLFTSNLLLAINRHELYSAIYLLATIAAVLLGIPLCKSFGTDGAALALIAFEITMIVLVYRAASKIQLVDWRLVLQEMKRGLTVAKSYIA